MTTPPNGWGSGTLREYVISERNPASTDTRVCMRDECPLPAAYRCRLDLVARSGAVNSGYSSSAWLCAEHAVDYLKFSLL